MDTVKLFGPAFRLGYADAIAGTPIRPEYALDMQYRHGYYRGESELLREKLHDEYRTGLDSVD